jgi:hypothetical protein
VAIHLRPRTHRAMQPVRQAGGGWEAAGLRATLPGGRDALWTGGGAGQADGGEVAYGAVCSQVVALLLGVVEANPSRDYRQEQNS